MARAERKSVIEAIERERGSKVISYVTSTRAGMEVQMAMDVPRIVYEHLRELPPSVEQIDLFLHSNGGDGVVPWRLVTLLRERCSKLAVLIPHRAFSAATLTALGADEIVMLPLGMLGPIDPTTTTPFNPVNSTTGQLIGIGVEDVSAYVALVKEDVGITHEDELVQAFNLLADKVHPLALGNVKRTSQQSRMMARKLLLLHMDRTDDDHKIDQIVEALSSRLFYHGHPINRREARTDLGLKVIEPPETVESLIWDLYLEYETSMKLLEPFNPALEFLGSGATPGAAGAPAVAYDPAEPNRLSYVESAAKSTVFEQFVRLSANTLPNGAVQGNANIMRQGWRDEG